MKSIDSYPVFSYHHSSEGKVSTSDNFRLCRFDIQGGNFRLELHPDKDSPAKRITYGKPDGESVDYWPGTNGIGSPARFSYWPLTPNSIIEKLLPVAFYGPGESARKFWRDAQVSGDLKIDRRQIEGTDCVVVTANRQVTALAPEWDWAIVRSGGANYGKYSRVGEGGRFWFPSKIEYHWETNSPTFNYIDHTLNLEKLGIDEHPKPDLIAALPSPRPKAGDDLEVFCPNWNPDWEMQESTQPDTPESFLMDLNRDTPIHRIVWMETHPEPQASILKVSQSWRSRERVSDFFSGKLQTPMPFYSQDTAKIVWATYDPAKKRLRIAAAPAPEA